MKKPTGKSQNNGSQGFEHWLIKLDTASDVQFGEAHAAELKWRIT
jgi:hypothetical protein